MLPKSIRWRLPLSYAGIALLAAVALGAVLLTTLRGYYAQREFEHLRNNGLAISRMVSEMYRYELSDDEIQRQLESLAFLGQTRIRVLDSSENIIADSGDAKEPRVIALNFTRPVDAPDILFQAENSENVVSGVAGERWTEEVSPDYPAIDIFSRLFTTAPEPEQSDEEVKLFDRRFFMAVAGTPYGFNLNTDVSIERHSDQHIQMPFYDRSSYTLTGYVELLDGPAYGTEVVDGVALVLINAGLVAVVLAAGVGWLISRQINTPLSTLTAATSHMADGNLSVRVTMPRHDEFGVLADAFNHMAGQVETTVTTLRRFVADAAHEIHTPITALHANLELAATEENQSQLHTFIQRAQEQLKRLEMMTSSLLDLSRIEAGEIQAERTSIDLVALVAEVSELYASRAEQACLTFQTETTPGKLIALANETQIRRVISNLLDNAIKFTPENGIIRIGICREDSKTLHLWVQDTGIGIPADDLPHLFNRFRRGRNAAAYPGSGLGLAIIKAIVEGHGGKVKVESSTGGTRFSLQLPAAA
jgi:signal transduction histidine kinase